MQDIAVNLKVLFIINNGAVGINVYEYNIV